MNSRIQEHVVADIETSENGFKVTGLVGVVIVVCIYRKIVVVISGVSAFLNFRQIAQFHFVIAIMDFCAERQILDGVKFNATTVSACLNDNLVRICLEFADSRVERVEQYFMRCVVGIVETQIVYLKESLAVAKTPCDNWLDMHTVHGDVAPAKGNICRVAAKCKKR